jgi:hypothetical protein
MISKRGLTMKEVYDRYVRPRCEATHRIVTPAREGHTYRAHTYKTDHHDMQEALRVLDPFQRQTNLHLFQVSAMMEILDSPFSTDIL